VLTASEAQPWGRMKDGKPKLAKWGFVPKGSTVLTDPADYLAFALRELWTNPKGKKAAWCKPILKSGGGRGLGAILRRDTIRQVVATTQVIAAYRNIEQQLSRLVQQSSFDLAGSTSK